MSKFNWRNGFAVGLTLGIGLTVLALTAISTGEAPSDLGQPNRSAYNGENEQNALIHWARRLVSFEDTSAQWVMTFATIFAAFLLLRTLWATQEIAADTRRIGEAQVRAYLGIVSATYSRNKFGNTEITVSIVNSGQSPARHAAGHCYITLVESDPVGARRIGNPETPYGIGDVPSMGSKPHTFRFEPITSPKQIRMMVDIKISFRTVFHKPDSELPYVRYTATGVFDTIPDGPSDPVVLLVFPTVHSEDVEGHS